MPAETQKKQTQGGIAFDPQATALLKNWLSVSESQTCALEVLCAQIPLVSKLLETSMCDISERFVAMASDFEQYANHTTQALSEPTGSTLEQKLQDALQTLHNGQTKEAEAKLEQIIYDSNQQSQALNESRTTIEEFGRTINEAISRIIVDMQFQDRVSQNLVIVTNVLNAVIRYLQGEIDDTISNFNERNDRADLDKDFAQQLLKLLTLGELQHKFMDHLVTHHYISDYAELGYDPNAHPTKKDDDNIDLF